MSPSTLALSQERTYSPCGKFMERWSTGIRRKPSIGSSGISPSAHCRPYTGECRRRRNAQEQPARRVVLPVAAIRRMRAGDRGQLLRSAACAWNGGYRLDHCDNPPGRLPCTMPAVTPGQTISVPRSVITAGDLPRVGTAQDLLDTRPYRLESLPVAACGQRIALITIIFVCIGVPLTRPDLSRSVRH